MALALTSCCNVPAETVRVVGREVTRCTACKRHTEPTKPLDVWDEIEQLILDRCPIFWCPLMGTPEEVAARHRAYKTKGTP